MSRTLTSALAAALAAGAAVAVTAVAATSDPKPATPVPAAAPPVLPARLAPTPPPTRAEAIERSAAYRQELEAALAEELGVDVEVLRRAEREVLAGQLAERVDRKVVTAAQRDALLACFDDPKGCDRGALPAAGGVPSGPVVHVATPARAPRAVRGGTRRARRAPRPRRVRFVDPSAAALARALGGGRDADDVRKALSRARRAAGPVVLDPDGVGGPLQPFPLAPVTFAAPAPAPLPAAPPPAVRRSVPQPPSVP